MYSNLNAQLIAARQQEIAAAVAGSHGHRELARKHRTLSWLSRRSLSRLLEVRTFGLMGPIRAR